MSLIGHSPRAYAPRPTTRLAFSPLAFSFTDTGPVKKAGWIGLFVSQACATLLVVKITFRSVPWRRSDRVWDHCRSALRVVPAGTGGARSGLWWWRRGRALYVSVCQRFSRDRLLEPWQDGVGRASFSLLDNGAPTLFDGGTLLPVGAGLFGPMAVVVSGWSTEVELSGGFL